MKNIPNSCLVASSKVGLGSKGISLYYIYIYIHTIHKICCFVFCYILNVCFVYVLGSISASDIRPGMFWRLMFGIVAM